MTESAKFLYQNLRNQGVEIVFPAFGKPQTDDEAASFILNSIPITKREWEALEVQEEAIPTRTVFPQIVK